MNASILKRKHSVYLFNIYVDFTQLYQRFIKDITLPMHAT